MRSGDPPGKALDPYWKPAFDAGSAALQKRNAAAVVEKGAAGRAAADNRHQRSKSVAAHPRFDSSDPRNRTLDTETSRGTFPAQPFPDRSGPVPDDSFHPSALMRQVVGVRAPAAADPRPPDGLLAVVATARAKRGTRHHLDIPEDGHAGS